MTEKQEGITSLLGDVW